MEKCLQILLFQAGEQKTPRDPCLVHCSICIYSLSGLPNTNLAVWIAASSQELRFVGAVLSIADLGMSS